jgi:hypothetical protein
MFSVSPAVQVVPAASCWTTDHVPLAHCWNEVPPIQFHCPSVVQAEPAVIAEPEPVVPVLAGADEETGAGAPEATGVGTTLTTGDTTGATVG